MLLLKIVSLVVVYVTALVKDLWAEPLSRHIQTKRLLFWLMTLAALVGVVSTLVEEQQSNEASLQQSQDQQFLAFQNVSLRAKLDSLVSLTQQGEAKFDRENAVLQSKVSELNSKLEPFVKLAVTKYPAFDIQTALNSLARDIAEAKDMAKPAILIAATKEIKRIDGGYSLTLQFRPSKNQMLGRLEFVVEIAPGSNATIFDFWPTRHGGAFQSGKDSKKIATDGKSARLIYSLMSAGNPTIELKVTEETDLLVAGNYLESPIQIRIE